MYLKFRGRTFVLFVKNEKKRKEEKITRILIHKYKNKKDSMKISFNLKKKENWKFQGLNLFHDSLENKDSPILEILWILFRK